MKHWPRLHLVHQLALLLTGAAVLAIAITGGFTVWNLRTGFSEYMRLRDHDAVEQLSRLIAQRAAQEPNMEWLRRNREAYRALLRSAGVAENDTRRGDPERHERPERPPPPGPAYGSIHIADRLYIVDANGQHLAGRPQPQGARQSTHPITVGGTTVARILLTDAPQPSGIDAAFLRRQITGLAWAALAALLLALLAAWVIAKRWSRPLREVQRASQRIAQGHRTVHLAPEGAVEVVALMADINHMAQSLSRLEDARKRWLAHLSHELRTPLSVLRGELESIEDGARKPTPSVIHNLQQEVLQLSRLIDDLHTLATNDLEGVTCQSSSGDVQQWLTHTLARWETSATAQHIHIALVPPANPSTRQYTEAHWDWARMDQVMANLITNSLRYTDTPGRIEVGMHATATHITITVDDSAPGVTTCEKEALFDPLFRVDTARQRHFTASTKAHEILPKQASGLGLSIVRSIVQAHQGHVYADNSPLGGLRMVMQLPRLPHLPEPAKTP